MHSPFRETLTASVALLRDLPRDRTRVGEAQKHVEQFRQMHPDEDIDLLVDYPPGSDQVDYDVYLDHPDGGTVAVSWRPDDGTPWAVQYADHWASNYMASVGDFHLTVQQALLFFRFRESVHSGLMDSLMEELLVGEAIQENPPEVSESEVQAAADAFRTCHGLLSEDATRRWLQETGISIERFGEIMQQSVRFEKFRDSVTRDLIEPYWQAHAHEFDQVQYFRIYCKDYALITTMTDLARNRGLVAAAQRCAADRSRLEFEAELSVRPACQLPPSLGTAAPGGVIGPVSERPRYWIAEILRRVPADLDPGVRAAVRDRLFRDWLAERRKQKKVCWHWL